MGFYIYFFLTFIISKIYSYEVVFHLMCQIQCQNISIEYRNPLDAENIRTYNYLFPGYDDLNFSKITLFPKILTNNKKIIIHVYGGREKPGICGYVTVNEYIITTQNTVYWELYNSNSTLISEAKESYCGNYSYLTYENNNEELNNEIKTINISFTIPENKDLKQFPLINNDYELDNKTYFLSRNNKNKVEIKINLFDFITPNFNGKIIYSTEKINIGNITLNKQIISKSKKNILVYQNILKYSYSNLKNDWNKDDLNNYEWDTLTYKIYRQGEKISKEGKITFKICGEKNCNLCNQNDDNNLICDNTFYANVTCLPNCYFFDKNNKIECSSCDKINNGTREKVTKCVYPYSYTYLYDYDTKFICYKFCPQNLFTLEEEKKCISKCPIFMNKYKIQEVYNNDKYYEDNDPEDDNEENYENENIEDNNNNEEENNKTLEEYNENEEEYIKNEENNKEEENNINEEENHNTEEEYNKNEDNNKEEENNNNEEENHNTEEENNKNEDNNKEEENNINEEENNKTLEEYNEGEEENNKNEENNKEEENDKNEKENNNTEEENNKNEEEYNENEEDNLFRNLEKNTLNIKKIYNLRNNQEEEEVEDNTEQKIIGLTNICVAELPYPIFISYDEKEYMNDCTRGYHYYSLEEYICVKNCSETDLPYYNQVSKNNEKYNFCVKECDSSLFIYDNICYETCPYYISEKEGIKICVNSCHGKYFIHNIPSNNNKSCENQCSKYLYISQSYQYYCYDECPNNSYLYENSDSFINLIGFCYDECKDYLKYYKKKLNNTVCVDKCDNNEYANSSNYICSNCINGYIYGDFCYQSCPKNTLSYENKDRNEKLCLDKCLRGTYISLDEKSCVITCGNNQEIKDNKCTCKNDYYINITNFECVISCNKDNYMRLEEKKLCVKECPNYYKKENKTQSNLIDCVYSCDSDFPFLTEDYSECLKECPKKLYKKIENKLICTSSIKEAEDIGSIKKGIHKSLSILLPLTGILIIILILVILKRRCNKKLITSKEKVKNKKNKTIINESDIISIRSKINKSQELQNSNIIENKI